MCIYIHLERCTGWALTGRCKPWALTGWALMGLSGPYGPGPHGRPWALMGRALLGPPGPYGPGPYGPAWALMGHALMGRALMGPQSNCFLFFPRLAGPN